MTSTKASRVNQAVVEKAIRHINHHGGEYDEWYVGIEETGSDRDSAMNRRAVRYEMTSEDEAKRTMSRLLGMGLTADDEYGAEPTILFIYTTK